MKAPDTNRAVQIDCPRCTIQTKRKVKKLILEHDVCYEIKFTHVSATDRQIGSWYELNIRVPDFSQGIQKRKSYWKLYVAPLTAPLVPGKAFISIRPGHTHIISVSTEHYKSMNTSKEPCIEINNDPGRQKYSATACLLNCMHRLVKEIMNCSLFNLASDLERNLSEYCNIANAKRWSDDMSFRAMKMVSDNITVNKNLYETCVIWCLPACESWNYRTEVDIHLSHKLQMKPKEHNVTTAKILFVNGDVMAGGILTYTEVDTYTFDTLVGNIGGVLGIWIGASVLTLIQLFAFCSQLFTQCGKRYHTSKSIKRKSKQEEMTMLK